MESPILIMAVRAESKDKMPIIKKKMKALKTEYGAKKGKQVYYALENKAKKKVKKN